MTRWNKVYQKEGNKFTSKINNWNEVVNFFREKAVKSILDLGCGNGNHTFDLAQKGFVTTGFDISQEAIQLAEEKFQQTKLIGNFFVGTMHQKLPFKDNSFEAVICLRTLNHGKKDQVQKTINESWRILKPKGYVFISTIKILGPKNSQGKVVLNQMPVNFIAPYTYQPLEGKEIGITHFIFNKKTLLKMFGKFKLVNFWLDIGERHWEKYYCLLAQKN
jgi:2-polyprenyl-3-methyl-5-hydroxy-6-metoxy-1,4-benzoquinol methylase